MNELLNNTDVVAFIKKYNINDRANTMLYKDKEVAEMLKTLHNIDRFSFVMMNHRIERELIPFVLPYNGRNIIVTYKNEEIKGVIEHLPVREYTTSDGTKAETTNNVSFRTYKNGTQGIALWINTGYRISTHLYNAEDIVLI